MDEDVVRGPWYHPGTWGPYVFLAVTLIPLLMGYAWLIVASFSRRTEGLVPVGGLTLDNWAFLYEGIESGIDLWQIGIDVFVSSAFTTFLLLALSVTVNALFAGADSGWKQTLLKLAGSIQNVKTALTLTMIFFAAGMFSQLSQMELGIWSTLLNTFLIAVYQTITVVLVSSMAAYALSRMNFPGRRPFLSLTLILHGFPAVTLLIPIFFVLKFLGDLPVVGDAIGFNSLGGVALVMVSFQLPLGVWLMKGFFDNIPWDTERSALVDGATYFQTWRMILMPLIRPGIMALGIFSFISGWGAFLIPTTFTIGTRTANLPVYLRAQIDATAPVNWGSVAAIGLFQMIPVLLFFFFAQEYLLSIFAGGSKGAS